MLDAPSGHAVGVTQEGTGNLLARGGVLVGVDLGGLALDPPHQGGIVGVRAEDERCPGIRGGCSGSGQISRNPAEEGVVGALQRVLGDVVAGGDCDLVHESQQPTYLSSLRGRRRIKQANIIGKTHRAPPDRRLAVVDGNRVPLRVAKTINGSVLSPGELDGPGACNSRRGIVAWVDFAAAAERCGGDLSEGSDNSREEGDEGSAGKHFVWSVR